MQSTQKCFYGKSGTRYHFVWFKKLVIRNFDVKTFCMYNEDMFFMRWAIISIWTVEWNGMNCYIYIYCLSIRKVKFGHAAEWILTWRQFTLQVAFGMFGFCSQFSLWIQHFQCVYRNFFFFQQATHANRHQKGQEIFAKKTTTKEKSKKTKNGYCSILEQLGTLSIYFTHLGMVGAILVL